MVATRSEAHDPAYLATRSYRVQGGAPIEADYLSYAPHPHAPAQPTIVSPAPYAHPQPLPGQLDNGLSPHTAAFPITSPPTQPFPGLYGVTYKSAPQLAQAPMNYSPNSYDGSSVSPDSQRPSSIGQIPSVKSKASRKMSMHDGRRDETYIPSRPATMHGNGHGHARAMSQNDLFAPAPVGNSGLVIDARVQVPSMNHGYGYTVPMPRTANSWTGHGSMSSYYDGSMDQAIADSPITPLRPLPAMLPTEDSSKRQKRRESHNQVEKRRREHINAKIEELGKLLPITPGQHGADDYDDDDDYGSSRKKKKRTPGSKKANDNGQCKGRILADSVKYIGDLRKENHHLSIRIQQLEAALASKGSGPAPPMQIQHTNFWSQSTPVRREIQGYIPAPAAQAHYQPHQPRFMAPDQPLEAMPPTPEHEGQMDEESFQMSWSVSNNSATATASGNGSASVSESPVAPGASSDSNYSPENGSSTIHSSSSQDSSPTGTALDLQGPSFGHSLQYPTNGNNGLGLEFVPGAMEMQVGTMGWQG